MKISAEAVEQALNAVVDEHGEGYLYQYEDSLCKYRHRDGKPGCLVGHVFDRLGVLDELVGDDDYLNGETVDTLRMSRSASAWPFDQATTEALCDAQTYQNTGGTWGVAREAFHAGAEAVRLQAL